MSETVVNVKMDKQFKKDLHHKAIDEEITLNQFILNLLEKGLKEYDD